MSFGETAKKVSKAIAAGASAGAAALGTAGLDGTITGGEWLAVIAAVAGAFLVTYAAPRNSTDT